jgi:acyl-CoA thioesterase-1
MLRIVAFVFVGGDAFFCGAALLGTAVLIAAWRSGNAIRSVCRLATVVAAIVIAASGTPLPLWFYCVGIVLGVLMWAPRRLPTNGDRAARFRVFASLVAAWCLVAATWEASYRAPPRFEVGERRPGALAVIGDSISAGLLGPNEATWPKQIRTRYRVDVIDLSREGATARSAIKQAEALNEKLPNVDIVVVVEIGGNDYFESVPAKAFSEDLDRLLTRLERHGRQVVLLELPLPPLYNAYGRVQRVLAKKHGIPMISKREFARVVFAPDATLDTVHLSMSGHALFAEIIWRHVGGLLAR